MSKYFSVLLIVFFAIQAQSQAIEGTLLGRWFDNSLVPSSAHFNTYNEIWGLAVNDHEFAVIGSTLGTHFIDVTDPNNPEELFVVEGGSIGAQIIHRDFHDYKGYLYSIADEGSQTSLQIIDITQLPDTLEVVYDDRKYFTRSHNIFIDTATARLYSLISNGTSFGYAPMRIFDISNPIDPQPIGAYYDLDGYGISQVHDAFVRNDTAYLNLGPGGFALVDFENVDTPNVISVLDPFDYPQAGYNHSGWPTDNGDFYYMADENIGKDIKVMDMRNLPEIEVPYTFNASNVEQSIPHNQLVHGDKLYVSYYFHGLQVYDLSNPAIPEKVMYYDTSDEIPAPNLYRGAWGVYPYLPSGNILVSDMQNGLFVIAGLETTSTNEEVVLHEMITYPNPAYSFITIDLPEASANISQYSIYGMDGQLVKKGNYQSGAQISVENLNRGLYLIEIKSDSKRYINQISIEK